MPDILDVSCSLKYSMSKHSFEVFEEGSQAVIKLLAQTLEGSEFNSLGGLKEALVRLRTEMKLPIKDLASFTFIGCFERD